MRLLLLSASQDAGDILRIAIPIAVVVVLFLFFILIGYVKAPPDTAFIISGLRKKSKILIGRAGIKMPFLERLDKLSLKLIPLDIKTGDAVPTADCINIFVDSAVNVKVSSEIAMVQIAAQNFLNKTPDDIGRIVSEVLEGNIREIICTMKLRDLIGDRKAFVERVSENVIPDLQKMGLELVSFNVQRFSDANHVIEDLGIDNISQIKKDAAIAKANADKEVEIAQAIAAREANDAKVASDAEIAVKQNDLAIKKAELKKNSDIKQAEADAAYKIQEEEQRKSIEITTANANLARQEKELELKEREVAIQEKTLEANIKKQADADKYAAQQKADAAQYERQKKAEADLYERQKKAEAEKFEAEKEAEAKRATAEAEKFAKVQEAEAIKAAGLAEAAAIEARGRAEAEAIQAKAEAEAAGILKKAEAMKEYGDAARQQMELDTLKVYFEQLPKIAEAIGLGYSNVESIKMFGGDTSQFAGNIMTTVTQVTDGIKESTGVDVSKMFKTFANGKGEEKEKEKAATVVDDAKTDYREV
ncbi:MAG: flotillin family protein [Lachnospiraceae bacterium]|nr:flotillin family protein [Lachnospiraceae bacterium]